MSDAVIETRGLTKEYVRDEFHVNALKDVDISIAGGEFCRPNGSFRFGQIHAAAYSCRSACSVQWTGYGLR